MNPNIEAASNPYLKSASVPSGFPPAGSIGLGSPAPVCGECKLTQKLKISERDLNNLSYIYYLPVTIRGDHVIYIYIRESLTSRFLLHAVVIINAVVQIDISPHTPFSPTAGIGYRRRMSKRQSTFTRNLRFMASMHFFRPIAKNKSLSCTTQTTLID